MKRIVEYWWVGFLALFVLAAAGLAFGPKAQLALQQATVPDQSCSPKPCVAPDGFELDVQGATVSNGVVEVAVFFKNHTPKGFGAGNYRPTLPSDFRLQLADGRREGPFFTGDCSDWGELHVVRGESAGPEKVCFRAGSLKGADLIWSPDLGFTFDAAVVPIG